VFDRLGVSFLQRDVFSDATQSELGRSFFAGPTYLVCDDGDKRREFRTYVPLLRSGSIVSVHDFGCEFMESDVMALSVETLGKEEWLCYNVQFATWRVLDAEKETN
jgi:hypothetical protein